MTDASPQLKQICQIPIKCGIEISVIASIGGKVCLHYLSDRNIIPACDAFLELNLFEMGGRSIGKL